MEITYTMIGADGAQYGPVTLPNFQTWISEGRILPDTKVMRSDTMSWLPASSYPELNFPVAPANVLVPPPMPTSPAPISPVRAVPAGGYDPRVVVQLIRGAQWFYWIAALSIINIVLGLAHAGIQLIFGELGLASKALELVAGSSGNLNEGVAAYIIVSAFFAVFGVFARKGQVWAFIVGALLYVVDGIVVILEPDWIALALHAYVLFRIFMGLKAAMQLKAVKR
ncbi:MAG TPA: DUF4339 domain-containing protein [Verrucomicrobiae bacterium]|jgi:hypothetical protein|nr:DUF4339 domain-containing protein [Verrucomicrobiae bacterium]